MNMFKRTVTVIVSLCICIAHPHSLGQNSLPDLVFMDAKQFWSLIGGNSIRVTLDKETYFVFFQNDGKVISQLASIHSSDLQQHQWIVRENMMCALKVKPPTEVDLCLAGIIEGSRPSLAAYIPDAKRWISLSWVGATPDFYTGDTFGLADQMRKREAARAAATAQAPSWQPPPRRPPVPPPDLEPSRSGSRQDTGTAAAVGTLIVGAIFLALLESSRSNSKKTDLPNMRRCEAAGRYVPEQEWTTIECLK